MNLKCKHCNSDLWRFDDTATRIVTVCTTCWTYKCYRKRKYTDWIAANFPASLPTEAQLTDEERKRLEI